MHSGTPHDFREHSCRPCSWAGHGSQWQYAHAEGNGSSPRNALHRTCRLWGSSGASSAASRNQRSQERRLLRSRVRSLGQFCLPWQMDPRHRPRVGTGKRRAGSRDAVRALEPRGCVREGNWPVSQLRSSEFARLNWPTSPSASPAIPSLLAIPATISCQPSTPATVTYPAAGAWYRPARLK
jgi:hypothetical protein